MSWNFDFFFSFFVIELQTSSCLLISEPKAWRTWVEILNFFFHSLWLNFKLQTACWRSQHQRPWYLSPWLGSHKLKFWFFFHSLWLNFKPQTASWRSRCRDLHTRALARLTWVEILMFFLHSLWLNFKPQPVCWYLSLRLSSHELKSWFFFSFFVIKFQTSNC
jgi:hypothetical protein